MKINLKNFENTDIEYELFELELLFNQCSSGRIRY